MKRRFLVIIAVLAALVVRAQNIVPNGDFEKLKQKPCGWISGNEISSYIYDWKQASGGSSDIVSDEIEKTCPASCSAGSTMGFGEQQPHSGHTAAMIRTLGSSNYREYLAVTLSEPMIKGKKYYVEMFVSACDRTGIYTNNIGMCFYTGTHKVFTGSSAISGNPLINHTTIVNDVKGWTKISGYIVADQNYTWISIGNFLSEEKTLVEKAPAMERRFGQAEACYYLDDVTVRLASSLRVTGDTLVDSGKRAALVASGAEKYSWADSARPAVIIGTGPNISVGLRKRTTYYVYSESDTAKITVNVRHIGPVYQDTIQGRKVRKGRTINVESDVITISVYDKNEIDGDSITLYYGDSLIVQDLALTKKKQSFTIKVDRENPQQLILFAENQGSVPPNTACIIIKDGKNDTQVILASDFKWCDSIMIAWKKEE